jgi:hypothetical protein
VGYRKGGPALRSKENAFLSVKPQDDGIGQRVFLVELTHFFDVIGLVIRELLFFKTN